MNYPDKRLKDRAVKIALILEQDYPGACTALNFSSPFELLIATILSAQCTDKKVNEVTKSLFKKYRSAQDYGRVDINELEAAIRPTGFYRNKTRSIKGCCQELVKKFKGKVPDNIDDMAGLKGVGRKTANVVLANAFGQPAIPVDTHVRRLVDRLQLSTNTDPDKIEADLQKLLPKDKWSHFSHALILHGRAVCIARKPQCPQCHLNPYCPYPAKTA